MYKYFTSLKTDVNAIKSNNQSLDPYHAQQTWSEVNNMAAGSFTFGFQDGNYSLNEDIRFKV